MSPTLNAKERLEDSMNSEKQDLSIQKEHYDISTTRDPELTLDYGENSESIQAVSEEERKLVWKLDKRILPITCLMYLFSCLCTSLNVLPLI